MFKMSSNILKLEKRDINLDTPNREQILNCGCHNLLECHIIGKGSYGTVIKGIYKGKLNFIYVLYIHVKLDMISAYKYCIINIYIYILLFYI